MNYKRLCVGLLLLLAACGQKTTEQTAQDSASTTSVNATTATAGADVNKESLFADSNFTFLNLDSLDENRLRDMSVTQKYSYIKSVKRFTKEHCKFFKTGCSGSFFDDNVFLVAKQQRIGNILPVIIHDSKDFDFYHSDLYTLDEQYNKVDSVRVSLSGYGMKDEDTDYKTEASSTFNDNKITTTEITWLIYGTQDSVVMQAHTVTYREIANDGKIRVLKKEKFK